MLSCCVYSMCACALCVCYVCVCVHSPARRVYSVECVVASEGCARVRCFRIRSVHGAPAHHWVCVCDVFIVFVF